MMSSASKRLEKELVIFCPESVGHGGQVMEDFQVHCVVIDLRSDALPPSPPLNSLKGMPMMFFIFRNTVVQIVAVALIKLSERNLGDIGRINPPSFANVLMVQVALSVGGVVSFRFLVGTVEDGADGGFSGHFQFRAPRFDFSKRDMTRLR